MPAWENKQKFINWIAFSFRFYLVFAAYSLTSNEGSLIPLYPESFSSVQSFIHLWFSHLSNLSQMNTAGQMEISLITQVWGVLSY